MILNIVLNKIVNLNNDNIKKLDDLYNNIYKKAENSKVYSSNCDIVRLDIVTKRKWYRFWRKKTYYYYYCQYTAKTQKNYDKITKDLSVTKNYLNEKFDNFTKNFINKFDIYLKNYVNCSQTLYNNLFNYTNGKTINNSNIQMELNNYKIIFDDILNNNKEEILYAKIISNNLINNSKILETLNNFENNIFQIKNNITKFNFSDRKDFLEYPEEIIFKLNQSTNIIKTNIETIKNIINLPFNERIKNIIKSTKLFINNFNQFNFDYIINRISKEDIFNDYYNHKYNFLNDFFTELLNSIDNKEDNSYSLILNNTNYDNPNNIIVNNYTNYLRNLTKEINDNFIDNNCQTFYFTDSAFISDDNQTDRVYNVCTLERYVSKENYSKYNFNIVKFRTGITNSRKFPEMFSSLFEDLNYENIISSKEIIEIDNIINNKNLLFINNQTKIKLKEIKNEFLSIIQESFDEFSDDFIKNTPELTDNYWEILNSHKNLLNYENILYNKNITEVNNNLCINVNMFLDQFNNTLFYSFDRMLNRSNYDYYSINYTTINRVFNNQFIEINESFNKSIQIIKALKSDNLFYSIPKIYLNKIYLSRINQIEEIISNYSNEYDFSLFWYKYDFGYEFKKYLRKYYMYHELNNTYDYFELIQNNSDIYISQLLKNISYLKNITESKFYLIVNEFIKYMKSGKNYVENEFIEELKNNNSICLKAIPDLNETISEYLNYTNLTELDDFINNNCSSEGIINALINNSENDSCLNITDINYTIYSKEIDRIIDCQYNNNYNYTYIILSNFEKEAQENLDEYIKNITKTIESNIIDEHYLYNYIENYIVKNTSLNINITDYKLLFEDIEDLNFYINNLREPEYKNLMNNTLIESFNASYSNNVNLYIINEIINRINILVNYKFNIFIDYSMNKLRDDGDYYAFLLNSIDKLGNSSKTAIINLFTNIPKKLNESIYYLLEDDIFYYIIDIFFRENSKIFSNNFIDFYINDIKNYNINIYEIEDYVQEMISNRYFNYSLNNISLNLFQKIKDEIKEIIKNSTFSKLNTFIKSCGNISDNIKNTLASINTSELPNQMEDLINYINDYNFLVINQSSRYNFNFGTKPFDLTQIFIDEVLEPPLQLIYIKYQSIEDDLINETAKIADEFPNCVGTVETNLTGNKSEDIEENTYLINSTLSEYETTLESDIESYINKLIHFIYIDGLNTMDKSCENSYCGIERNYSLRQLEQNNILGILGIPKQNYNNHIINKREIGNKINKDIIFNIKRKTASLPEYSSDMGALSENDVIYYLSDLQDTILKLNKTFFGKEYLNINITTNKYLLTTNYTLLNKLRRSFDIKLVKFSTILTENSMKKLENILLKQYFLIEELVHNSSDMIRIKIDEFINEINNTYIFIENLSEYIYIKVIGYYKILYYSIQNKLKTIDNNRRLEIKSLETRRIASSEIDLMKNEFSNLLKNLDEEIKASIKKYIADKLQKIYKKIDSYLQKFSKKLTKKVRYKGQIGFPFPILPFFEIVLEFDVSAGRGLNMSLKTKNEDDLLPVIYIDAFVEAKVELYINGGFYIPSSSSPVRICFVVGLGGTVGDGRAGIKLDFSFMERKFDLNLYFILYVFRFEFYFRIEIYIDLLFTKYENKFYIVKYGFNGILISFNDPKNQEMGKNRLIISKAK